MCTTPQNILVPRDGIPTDAGPQYGRRVRRRPGRRARTSLLGDPARAAATLGAIVNERCTRASGGGGSARPYRPSRRGTSTHPDIPDAVVRTPLVARLDAEADEKTLHQ